MYSASLVWNSVALARLAYAHQGRVRRQHDVVAGHRCSRWPSPSSAHPRTPPPRCARRCARRALDGAGEAGQILARMEARLVVEAHARAADERHLFDERGVESELGGQRRFVAETRLDCPPGAAERTREDSREPTRTRRRSARRGRWRRSARSPPAPRPRPPGRGRGRTASTSSVSRVSVTIVRCALVWPVSICAQRSRSSSTTDLPAASQQIGGSQPGDAAADDDDVGPFIAFDPRGARHRCVLPVRCRVVMRCHRRRSPCCDRKASRPPRRARITPGTWQLGRSPRVPCASTVLGPTRDVACVA